MNLTVKNLPEETYAELKRAARESGRSLNAQVLMALREEAGQLRRRERMRRARAALERFVRSLPPLGDSTPLIREDRNR